MHVPQRNNLNQVEEKEEYLYGIVEYDSADFTDKTDFKVNKSEELSSVEYDNIFLHDKDSAQLDLKFSNDRIGTLVVSRNDSSYYSSDEEKSSLTIEGTEVEKVIGNDGIIHYSWNKNNVNYRFDTLSEFTNVELASIINGFTMETEVQQYE